MTKWRRVIGILGLYILVFAIFVGVYLILIRPAHRTWGATVEEIKMPMPADKLVANPNYATTRAVTIQSRPEAVWPWLAQMGYQRGGLYSYDWLDRLQNILNRPSAATILPEFQNLKAGDEIPIGGAPGWPVASVEPNRSLVLDIRQPDVHITWSWLLVPINETATRLVLRIRGRLDVRLRSMAIFALLDPGEFAMVRKMLTGIKQRVEGTADTPTAELIELLTWCAAILFGLAALAGALTKKSWTQPFIVSWAALCLLFYLMLGQPPLFVGILLNIVLGAGMLLALFSKGRAPLTASSPR
jgi:hypothetical protein